jgi:hypothetical protein
MRTLQEIAAERLAAKQQAQASRAEWARQKATDNEYHTAWDRFIAACWFTSDNATAGAAVADLARLIGEHDKLARLEEVAEAFTNRPNESYAAALLLRAAGKQIAADTLGQELNAAATWADPGSFSDDADTLRCAVAADSFAPPPKPKIETIRILGTVSEATKKQRTQKKVERTWTQAELDAAIRAEIETHANLIADVRKGDADAKQKAKSLFGRNALADRLGLKSGSRNMVSASAPWRELADAIGLKRKSLKGSRIGLEIALEKTADADNGSEAGKAIRRETVAMIEGAIKSVKSKGEKAGLVDLLEKFNLGEVLDERARQIVNTLQGE